MINKLSQVLRVYRAEPGRRGNATHQHPVGLLAVQLPVGGVNQTGHWISCEQQKLCPTQHIPHNTPSFSNPPLETSNIIQQNIHEG